MTRPRLYTAQWVLPITAAPIRDGALLADERGRIAAVGPAEAVTAPEHAERIALGEAILLPALVNAHAHPELAAFRGLLEDLPFHQWIPRLLGIKTAAQLTQEDFVDCARWTCVESRAAGIASMGATETSAASLDAMVESGMRGIVYQEVFGPDPFRADDVMDELRAKLETLRRRATDRVRVGVSPHAPYTVSDRLYRKVAEYALAERLPVACHIAEAEAEEMLVVRGEGPFAAGLRSRGIATPRRGRSPIELLGRLGVLRARPLLIHCVRLSRADIARIADAGCAVAHCPVANARLGHGIAPVIEMLEAGVTVGLGSDSVASNNRIDILEEARAAHLFQRARARSAGALPAERLLRMATLEGARCLGLDSDVGSLEPSKAAELCVVPADGVGMIPVYDPAAAVVHGGRTCHSISGPAPP